VVKMIWKYSTFWTQIGHFAPHFSS